MNVMERLGDSGVDQPSRAEVGERLESVINECFPSKVAAAEVGQVSSDQLYKYFQGKSKIPFEVVMRIASAAGVATEWIWSGTGPRLQSDWKKDAAATFVPMVNAEFSAGSGRMSDEEQVFRIPIQISLLREWGIDPEHAAAARAVGDSMADTINGGDIIIMDLSDIAGIVSDEVYTFRLFDEMRIKRLKRLKDGGIAMISDNSSFETEELHGDDLTDFKLLGRVKSVWRSL